VYPQLRFQEPEGSTFITLVRHGQTEPADPNNPFPLCDDGHGDPSLTPLGYKQAAAAGGALASESIDHIYVSSLIRTHQTAAPLVAATGIKPKVERDLREVFLGDWEGGLFRKKAEEGHPAVAAFRDSGDWGNIPGAETNDQLIGRTSAAINAIHQSHPGEHVVCFVHGGVVAALFAYGAKTAMTHFGGTDNCGIHRLAIVEENRWLLRSFNDVRHLDGLRTPTAVIEQPV